MGLPRARPAPGPERKDSMRHVVRKLGLAGLVATALAGQVPQGMDLQALKQMATAQGVTGTAEAVPASSLEAKMRRPSGVTANCSGSEPTG